MEGWFTLLFVVSMSALFVLWAATSPPSTRLPHKQWHCTNYVTVTRDDVPEYVCNRYEPREPVK